MPKPRKSDKFKVGKILVDRRGSRGIFTASYTHNGRHRRRSLETTDRHEAAAHAEKVLAKLTAGVEETVIKPIEFGPAIQRYEDRLATERRSPKTCVKYLSELRRFTHFAADRGLKHVHQITPLLFEEYRAERGKKLEPYTMQNHGVIAKQWLEFLCSLHLIAVNPLAAFKINRVRRPKHPAALPEQVNAILAVATGDFRTILAVAAFTGLRINECLHLQVDQTDLDNRMLKILDSKTEAGEREVPIHQTLVPALRKAIGTRRHGYLFANPNPPRNPANRGREMPWNDRTVLKMFAAICTELGYTTGTKNRGLTVHALRRFFKTMAINGGVPGPLVDLWMGHEGEGMNPFYIRDITPLTFIDGLPFDLPDTDKAVIDPAA